MYTLTTVGLLFSLIPVIKNYSFLLDKIKYGRIDSMEYQAADYLNTQNVKGKTILCAALPLTYILTDTHSPTAITIPSHWESQTLLKIALGKDCSPKKFMFDILSKKPEYIIVKKNLFKSNSEPSVTLLKDINKNYELVKIINNWIHIYKLAEKTD